MISFWVKDLVGCGPAAVAAKVDPGVELAGGCCLDLDVGYPSRNEVGRESHAVLVVDPRQVVTSGGGCGLAVVLAVDLWTEHKARDDDVTRAVVDKEGRVRRVGRVAKVQGGHDGGVILVGDVFAVFWRVPVTVTSLVREPEAAPSTLVKILISAVSASASDPISEQLIVFPTSVPAGLLDR
jgi:hypothetical protein